MSVYPISRLLVSIAQLKNRMILLAIQSYFAM